MTEQKKLKQAVRSRMARTGESYTTARRHVVPPAPSPVRHRESALVRHALAAAGVELTEPMACGLGGGIGFLYAVFRYAQLPHPLLTIVAQHHPQPWAPAVLDRLGVAYEERHSTATTAALAKLAQALEHGPALCTVDRSRLPWRPEMVPGLAAADPYAVLVLAERGDELEVLDNAPVPVAVSRAAFGEAWAGHAKGRHHLLRITSVPTELDLAAAARDAVATTVAHLTGPVLGNSFDVNFGFSGMGKLAADLRATRGKSAWSQGFAGHLGYALRRLVDGVQRDYTAADATRPLYADFLAEAAPLLPELPRLPEAIAAIRAAGRGWASAARVAEAAAEKLAEQPAEQPAEKGGDGAAGRATLDELAALVEANLAHERIAAQCLTGQPVRRGRAPSPR